MGSNWVPRSGAKQLVATEQQAWITLVEAAQRLGLTKEAVRRRAQLGQLPAKKENGTWYVDPSAIEEENHPKDQEGAKFLDPTALQVYQDLNQMLRTELVFLHQQLERKDQIIAGLIQRVPQLKLAEEQPTFLPWWRRIFQGRH